MKYLHLIIYSTILYIAVLLPIISKAASVEMHQHLDTQSHVNSQRVYTTINNIRVLSTNSILLGVIPESQVFKSNHIFKLHPSLNLDSPQIETKMLILVDSSNFQNLMLVNNSDVQKNSLCQVAVVMPKADFEKVVKMLESKDLPEEISLNLTKTQIEARGLGNNVNKYDGIILN